MRDFQLPGRSPVYAANAMVATSHPLASAAALDILKSGGNAVDAAVCAAAVLAVVEPHMCGLGGDCFAVVAKPDGALFGLNGSGRSARGAHLSWYLEQGFSEIPPLSAHSITVPGAVKAWEALLARFGAGGFERLLEPALSYARDGFLLSPRVAFDWARFTEKLKKNLMTAEHYLKEGKPYQAGERIFHPPLVNVLQSIIKGGAKAFYEGAIAQDIAQSVQALGGFLSEEDLAGASVDWVDPLRVAYQRHDIFELPPNGQGITAMLMLNILKALPPVEEALSPQRFHLQMEAAKCAYGVRDAFIADPADMKVSALELIDPAYGASLARRIDPHRAGAYPPPHRPGPDTVYLAVVDRDGMACSLINSLYHDFGSGIMTERTGILLQSRACGFTLKKGHPNAIGPAKRPLHTIIPAMAFKKGKPALCFGVMGGAYQPCGHAHVLQNMLDYGMDPQSALDAPRVFWDDSGALALERGFGEEMATALAQKGHRIKQSLLPHGGGQIIAIDYEKGALVGGSDPRKDGLAIGY